MRSPRLLAVSLAALLSVGGLVAAVQPAAAVSGGTLAGVVRTADGTPLANTLISLEGGPAGDSRDTTTDATGAYTFTSVPAGAYTLEAQPWPGPYANFRLSRSVSFTTSTTANLTYPALTSTSVSVVSSTGSPAAGAHVSRDGADPEVLTPDGATVAVELHAAMCTTSTAGQCTVPNLVGTTPQFHASAGVQVDATHTVAATGDTVRLQLPPAYAVRGVLRDAEGTPVPAARIDLRQGTRGTSVMADENGAYVFPAVADGEYTLSSALASVPIPGTNGYMKADVKRPVTITGPATADLTFPRLVPVTMTVLDQSGARYYAHTVAGSGVANGPGDTTVTINEDAGCAADHASEPCLMHAFAGFTEPIAVSSWDAGTVTLDTAIPSDGGEITLRVPPTHTVSGVLRAGDGSPMENRTVTLAGGPNDETRTARTNTSGAYTFAGVLPGTYDIGTASPHDPLPTEPGGYGTVGRRSLTVADDTTVDLAFPNVVLLTATVVDSVGAPVEGARVVTSGSETTTSADGTPRTLAYTNGPLCVTDATGTCGLAAFEGMLERLTVAPPDGGAIAVDHRVPTGGGNVTVPLDHYVSVPSAGAASGDVVLSVPEGYELSRSTSDTVTTSPDGNEVLVGSLAYEVRGMAPGGPVDVTMTLPETARPTAVYKVAPDGTRTDASSIATITDNVVVMHLVDGGFGDDDGAANGVVRDPVIPTGTLPLGASGSALPVAVLGKPYAAQLAASGGRAPYAWTITEGALPAGLTMSAAGAISGTPSTLGSTQFVARVRSSDGSSATARYGLSVARVGVTTQSLPAVYVAKSWSQTLKALGGSGYYTWSVVGGALPPGIKLGTSGTLSGAATAPGGYAFTVRAKDSTGNTALQRLSMRVLPMAVTTSSLPSGVAGKAYPWTQLQVAGGKATYVWSIASGSLPAGLTLGSGGGLSGTPVSPGTATFTVRVTDGSIPKNVTTRTLTLTVAPMTVATTSLPAGKRGTWYSTTLKANGGKGTLTWSLASGALPPGLRIGAAGGISGTPTTAGTWSFTVRVADSSVPKNVATRTLSLGIS